MRKSFAAFAFAAVALVQPASAITFPTLTTIYVGAGVRDNVSSTGTVATAFMCSNVSGVAANVRFLVLDSSGTVADTATISVPHGGTATAVTNLISTFPAIADLGLSNSVGQGVVNIEATQSGVFCNALVMDRVDDADGVPLRLVRVNPHPGTVE